jgi:hypothetical protein
VIGRVVARVIVGVAALGACTALLSLAVGAAAGTGAVRSISGGFVLVGSLVFVAGALTGLRDPSRRAAWRRRTHGVDRGLRTWGEALTVSALLVGAGLLLVVVGIALDPETRW